MRTPEERQSDDALVLSVIGTIPTRKEGIYRRLENAGKRLDDRVIDRALQRLRKSGRIFLVRGPGGGWEKARPKKGRR